MAGNAKKVGRHKRTPSNVAYVAQNRWDRNKRLNVAKAAKRRDTDNNKRANMTVPRGTARKTRRNAARPDWMAHKNNTLTILPLSAFCV